MTHLPLTSEEAAERLTGILLICAAVFMFTALDTSAKYAGHFVPTLEVVWARYALSVVFAVIVLRPWRRWRAYATRRPVVQIVRALFLLASTALNFFAIHYLQLAETSAITFSAPLITTALAGPVLGEWAGPRRWAAIVVGFVGVLIIVQPEPGAFKPAALLSICSAFCYSGYALTTRLLSSTESPQGLLIYGSLLGAIAITPAVPAAGLVAPPTWLVAGALVMTGIAATAGHWFLILANRHAPATLLAPFNYTQIIWMVASGFLVFGDVPGPPTLAGALIIVASGLYVLYRERVHRDR